MSKDKETTRLDEMTIAEYKALPVEEQRKIEYQMVVDTFFKRAKEEAATSIDVFEQLSVINDTNRGNANRERYLGWGVLSKAARCSRRKDWRAAGSGWRAAARTAAHGCAGGVVLAKRPRPAEWPARRARTGW